MFFLLLIYNKIDSLANKLEEIDMKVEPHKGQLQKEDDL